MSSCTPAEAWEPTPETRVTVRFRSDGGNEYLYDDATSAIFPWSDLLETVLALFLSGAYGAKRDALVEKYGEREVVSAQRLIERWRTSHKAFTRPTAAGPPPPFSVTDLERHVRNNSFELLLVLTENCNLRCRYCALSDVYPLNRVRTLRTMSLETARRAVDWYAELVHPQRAQDPHKRFGLSLYGGEPLLNSSVLAGVLDYCQKCYPNLFIPVMTTNGTLLDRKNVELLVKYDVMVAVSIDGPAIEHDRLRVDAGEHGTFTRIARNLRRIREDFPDYWSARVTSISVYDWGTDLEAAERFFRENRDIIPRSVFVNQVGGHNTSWYSRYAAEDRDRLEASLYRLREQYKLCKISCKSTSDYLDCLVGIPIAMVGLRRRLADCRPDPLPYTGACIPGDKVAVHVDGKIGMCERVNGTYPIGDLRQGGIDYQRIEDILNAYRAAVLAECPACSVSRQCSLCFTHVEGRGTFVKPPGLCVGIRREAKRRMADYVSILEKNPKADFKFETDTARLEERMLLLY